jgi:hypothetical protein
MCAARHLRRLSSRRRLARGDEDPPRSARIDWRRGGGLNGCAVDPKPHRRNAGVDREDRRNIPVLPTAVGSILLQPEICFLGALGRPFLSPLIPPRIAPLHRIRLNSFSTIPPNNYWNRERRKHLHLFIFHLICTHSTAHWEQTPQCTIINIHRKRKFFQYLTLNFEQLQCSD